MKAKQNTPMLTAPVIPLDQSWSMLFELNLVSLYVNGIICCYFRPVLAAVSMRLLRSDSWGNKMMSYYGWVCHNNWAGLPIPKCFIVLTSFPDAWHSFAYLERIYSCFSQNSCVFKMMGQVKSSMLWVFFMQYIESKVVFVSFLLVREMCRNRKWLKYRDKSETVSFVSRSNPKKNPSKLPTEHTFYIAPLMMALCITQTRQTCGAASWFWK